MESAALAEAVARGAEPYPVLVVDWIARGLSLGRGVFSPAVRPTAYGQVTAVTKPAGWEAVTYGSGIEAGTLEVVRTSVSVSDKTRDLQRMMQTYDPRGSVARIFWAADGLAAADWEPIFVGIVEDWATDPPYTQIKLKTDDTVLRKPIPAAVFLRTEWGSAEESTIFGTHMPLVFGVHDAFLITARGMVPTVNILYDKDRGYWYLVSLGNLVEIRRVYKDGVSQADGTWSTIRGVYGGNLFTAVSFAEEYKPEKGVVVSVDCEGPDANGLSAGTSITNPTRVLRTLLEEYVYRDAPLAAYRGDASIIDDATWDAVEAWKAARGYDCGIRFGGDQDVQSAAEIVQSYLEKHPCERIWWTPLGKLAIGIFDPDDVDPDAAAWFDAEKHSKDGLLHYVPGDTREVYSVVKMPYMRCSSEQKFGASIEADDIAALPERSLLEIETDWAQARFNNE